MLNNNLKNLREDFIVNECISLPIFENDIQKYTYVHLNKSGYTTFQAIDILSSFFSLKVSDFGYAGLKDEDGITEQTISIRGIYDEKVINYFNQTFNSDSNKSNFIKLSLRGFGEKPIKIGSLHGNAFNLTVRNIDRDIVNQIFINKKVNLLFINYYDIQRFGIPDEKKVSHIIGEHLINRNYEHAFNLLQQNGTPEGIAARSYNGDAKGFFEELDINKKCFYKSSYSSFLWNQSISNDLKRISNNLGGYIYQEEIPMKWLRWVNYANNG